MRKLIVVLVVLLAGCTTWQPARGLFTGPGYTLDLPKDWMFYSRNNYAVVTKDGTELQKIGVSILDITDHDENEKKIVKKGMLPQEAAQVLVDRLKANKNLSQLSVLENAPAEIGGMEGFRLVYLYRWGDVRYKTVYYGMLKGEELYRIFYTAPVRYYFDKDIAVFEQIVKSFKLLPDQEEKAGKKKSVMKGEPEL